MVPAVNSSAARSLLTLTLALGLTSAIRAEPGDEADAGSDASPEPPLQSGDSKTDAGRPDPALDGHKGQVGLRAAFVFGRRMILRYDESPLCGEYDTRTSDVDQVKYCGHGGPLAIDVGVSFAPRDFIEPFLWGRFGISAEYQTDTEAVIILGGGARVYAVSESGFKLYLEPAIGLELEKGRGNQHWARFPYPIDVVVHVAGGPQFDVSRNVGLFLDGGLTMGFVRAFHSSLELRAGLQLRVP